LFANWGEPVKPRELRAKSVDELRKELGELLRAQFSLRMQHATQQLTNTSQLGKVRRDIARVRTILREKAGKQ
jgi:large subunit ribosomal protein L29